MEDKALEFVHYDIKPFFFIYTACYFIYLFLYQRGYSVPTDTKMEVNHISIEIPTLFKKYIQVWRLQVEIHFFNY